MLSNEELLYFLFMDEQERQEQEEAAAAHTKVNVEFLEHLDGEQTTQDRFRD